MRGSLVQALAGVGLLAGLYYTGRGFVLTRDAQMTDRFATAIGQLGNDSCDVRVGAILALERIARDSRKDSDRVMDVLVTFVREHAVHPSVETPDLIPADVQMAISVLGNRPTSRSERRRLQLHHTHLDGARFSEGDFRWVDLSYACLDGAVFVEAEAAHGSFLAAKLHGAFLSRANLEGADFFRAHLERAFLPAANLRGARFRQARLMETDFSDRRNEDGSIYMPAPDLAGADFSEAQIDGANFRGADLRKTTGFTVEQLKTALTDSSTLLPAGVLQQDL